MNGNMFDSIRSFFKKLSGSGGFVRDPSKKETSVGEYDSYNSPKVIENRLMFNIGDAEIRLQTHSMSVNIRTF